MTRSIVGNALAGCSTRNRHPFRSTKLRSISLNSAGCSLYEK